MSEIEYSNKHEQSTHPPTDVINGLFRPLNDSDRQVLSEASSFYEENDGVVFDELQKLRGEVGSIDGWREAKAKAEVELAEVPSDALETILARFTPYIKNLPAGHSKGHFLRDTVNLSMIFQDPSVSDYDAVEVFVGILGAMYHDIGNSVVERYGEQKKFAGHAEVGAHLFGKVSEDLIGENLRKMAQIAIAGHTHYTKDRVVTKSGVTRATAPYDDEVVDGDKIAIWWTRQADRMDTQGPIEAVRHMITKIDPTEDFDGQDFHNTWENTDDDFQHQFSPIFRSGAEISAAEKPANTRNILEHIKMYADSNFNDKLPYARHDNAFYTDLVKSAAADQDDFIGATTEESTTLSAEDRQMAFEKFFKLCELIEPAQNTGAQIEKMRKKLGLLTESGQAHWAHGFKALTDVIYPRMYVRFKEVIDRPNPMVVNDDNSAARNKVDNIVNNHLFPLAADVWEKFNPANIK